MKKQILLFILCFYSIVCSANAIVNFYPSVIGEEGETVDVILDISGTYTNSISIEYQVEGASSTIDYRQPSSTQIIVAEGNSTTISIELLDDDVAADGRELITITIVSVVGASIGNITQTFISIIDEYYQPIVDDISISLDGAELSNNFVLQNSGLVTISPAYRNISHTQTTAVVFWFNISSSGLGDLTNISDNSATFVFDTADVTASEYRVTMSIFDEENIDNVFTKDIRINVLEQLPSGYSATDLKDGNGNGISDINEIQPSRDYLSIGNVKVFAEPGVNLAIGGFSKKLSNGIVGADLIELEDLVSVDGSTATDYNYTNSNILNVVTSGKPSAESYYLVVEYPDTFSQLDIIRQYNYDAKDWRNLIRTHLDSHISALKTNGSCPAPRDKKYTEYVTESDETRYRSIETDTNCLQLRVVDGLDNDLTNYVNGEVELLFSVSRPRFSSVEISVSENRVEVGETVLVLVTVKDEGNLGVANLIINIGTSNSLVAPIIAPVNKMSDEQGVVSFTVSANFSGVSIIAASLDSVSNSFTLIVSDNNQSSDGGIGNISWMTLLLLLTLVTWQLGRSQFRK